MARRLLKEQTQEEFTDVVKWGLHYDSCWKDFNQSYPNVSLEWELDHMVCGVTQAEEDAALQHLETNIHDDKRLLYQRMKRAQNHPKTVEVQKDINLRCLGYVDNNIS